MLQKSLETPSDVIIYDLEDSVAPAAKPSARAALTNFLSVCTSRSCCIPTCSQAHQLPSVAAFNFAKDRLAMHDRYPTRLVSPSA